MYGRVTRQDRTPSTGRRHADRSRTLHADLIFEWVGRLVNIMAETTSAPRTIVDARRITYGDSDRAKETTVPTEDSGIERRLAAIVAIDVAGYSKLTAANETLASQQVSRLYNEVKNIGERFGGRIFNTAGDGMMLEFGSASSAVEAASAIALNCSPKVRVGVHIGDVIVQGNGDLLGHAVNVAARIMSQADAGAMLLSSDAKRVVHSHIASLLVPRGRRLLSKNG